MNRIDLDLHAAQSADPARMSLVRDCLADLHSLLLARRTVIESVGASVSRPFFSILVFWLMVIFSAFGLVAPRNSLSLIGIVLCAVSLSTVMFIIADLGEPYGGLFAISIHDMRNTLDLMMQPN